MSKTGLHFKFYDSNYICIMLLRWYDFVLFINADCLLIALLYTFV